MTAFYEWVKRLVGGWLPIGTKPFPEWLGKVLWAIGICVVVSIVMDRLFPYKPMTTTVGSGGTQIVYQDQRDTAGIGCNMWRGYIRAGVKQK